MTTATFYLLLLLVAANLWHRIRTPAPFEWVGELITMLTSLVVAFAGAYSLHVLGY